jgi:hypothetical protein
VGSYPISVGGAASPNYAIRYVNGTLTIVPPTSPSVLGDVAFVTSLYQNLLQTSPGPADLDKWLQALGKPGSATRVATAISRLPARRALVYSHRARGITLAIALRRAKAVQQNAIKNAQQALKAAHQGS